MRLLLLLAVLVVPVVVVVAAITMAVRAGRPMPLEYLTARELDVRRRWFRGAGTLLGLLGGVTVVVLDTFGRGLLLAAPVVAIGLLLGVRAAELSVHPPEGPRRSASLTVRRSVDYLPRRLTAVVAMMGVALLALMAATTLAGSADDMGRAGRVLTVQCTALTSRSSGPWPGSYYTGPLALVLLVGVVLALSVLRRVVARPPLVMPVEDLGAGLPGTPTGADLERADDVLRAQAARAVVAAVGVLLALPLAGVALVTGAVLARTGCGSPWWPIGAAATLLLAVLGLVVLVWSVSVLVVGSASVARPDRAGR